MWTAQLRNTAEERPGGQLRTVRQGDRLPVLPENDRERLTPVALQEGCGDAAAVSEVGHGTRTVRLCQMIHRTGLRANQLPRAPGARRANL